MLSVLHYIVFLI